jgi:hypothetical protein
MASTNMTQFQRFEQEVLRTVVHTPWPEAEQFCYDEHWKAPVPAPWTYLEYEPSIEVNHAAETRQK